MVAKAEATKQQILGAAIEEFSAHGIAGARVDRIAKAAGVNISMLFRYFGSKAQLFEAAFDALVLSAIDVVPFDAQDLPGYAGRLMEHYRQRPQIVRLSAWYRLERADQAVPARVGDWEQDKLLAIGAAQQAGLVSDHLAPEQVLSLVLHLSVAATGCTPVLTGLGADFEGAREAVVSAVAQVLAPGPAS